MRMLSWDSLNAKLWLVWFAYWIFASRGTLKTEAAEPFHSRALHLLPLLAAFGLLFATLPFLDLRLLPSILGPFGVFQTAFGLLFAVWARVHLGKYWSGRITLKQGHRLIRTGPYRWVRHPIYTGILCAFAGSALSQGKLRGLIGLLVISAAYYRKIFLEELTLHRRFGAEYRDYSRETSLLVPWT